MLSRSPNRRLQGFRGPLGRNRVDEEAAPPLEPSYARKLRDDLEVPVEGFHLDLPEGRRVQHEVEWRIAEHPVHAMQEIAEHAGQPPQLLLACILAGCPMPQGQYPRLERKPRGERRHRREALGFQDEAAAVAPLLPGEVAPD